MASWVWAALGSAFFASLTAILAKLGVAGTDANVATAIRTVIILVITWGIVIGQGKLSTLAAIPAKTWLFLVLSGAATGLSWLCYFFALKLGPVSRVAVLDKLSLALTLALSVAVLGETLRPATVAGVILMIAGALLASYRS